MLDIYSGHYLLVSQARKVIINYSCAILESKTGKKSIEIKEQKEKQK